MLTKVTAYSQWSTVDPLVLNLIDRPETDSFEVRNIDGLTPVKADINTTPFGSIPGAFFNGSNVGQRNLVFTIGGNPDWGVWTFSSLRRELNKYFMPPQEIRFVFESDEQVPVEISGYVESNEANVFSKDPEHQISIICPTTHFKSVNPVTVLGVSSEVLTPISYDGDSEIGIHVEAVKATPADADPDYVGILVEDNGELISLQANTPLGGDPPVTNSRKLSVNTISGDKYVKSIDISSGLAINLLNDIELNSRWPVIGPGTSGFSVYSNAGEQNWVLTYYNLFGSL